MVCYREAANEVSREKSASVAQKLSKTSIKSSQGQGSAITPVETNKHVNTEATCTEERCKDMSTQWDCEPNEWEPNIPGLLLAQDDKDSVHSVKETNNNIESKSDKNKQLDLFALSEDMPSSLRGGRSPQEEKVEPLQPSLTLVSEYLQTRTNRLRELQNFGKKKNSEELDSIKQTILRTRAAKAGTACLCQVHDEEIMPVPSWEAEDKCHVRSYALHEYLKPSRTCCYMHMNIFSPSKPLQTDSIPSPVLRGCTPFRRNRLSLRSCKKSNTVFLGFNA